MSIALKLKQLSQIDIDTLRDIDFYELKDKILERPTILINTSTIIGTLILAMIINGYFAVRHNQLQNNTQQLSDKLVVAERNLNLTNQIKDYQANFPKDISSENLMTEASKLAQKHNIKILSLTPQKGSLLKYLKTNETKIYITSDNFSNLLLYIKEIEMLPYAVIVNSWSSSVQKNRSSRSRNSSQNIDETPEIAVNLVLQTIELNNE